MKTHLYRWIIVLLIAVAGCGFFGNGTGYANPDGGSFEVPDVQKDFEQFEQTGTPTTASRRHWLIDLSIMLIF